MVMMLWRAGRLVGWSVQLLDKVKMPIQNENRSFKKVTSVYSVITCPMLEGIIDPLFSRNGCHGGHSMFLSVAVGMDGPMGCCLWC